MHGFQSSSAAPLHIGLPETSIDSIRIAWPSGAKTCLYTGITPRKTYRFLDSDPCAHISERVRETATVFAFPPDTLKYVHQELMVNDFKVQPLIPNMVSYHGPEIAIGDINGDGLQDL